MKYHDNEGFFSTLLVTHRRRSVDSVDSRKATPARTVHRPGDDYGAPMLSSMPARRFGIKSGSY